MSAFGGVLLIDDFALGRDFFDRDAGVIVVVVVAAEVDVVAVAVVEDDEDDDGCCCRMTFICTTGFCSDGAIATKIK